MRIKVLGSAAGGGFPQWNCNCRNCAGVRDGHVRAPGRARSRRSPCRADGDRLGAVQRLARHPRADPQPARRCSRRARMRDTAIAGVVLMDGADRPRHRPVDAARGRSRSQLWCTDPVARGPDHGQSGASACSATTAACSWHPHRRSTAAPFAVAGAAGLCASRAVPLDEQGAAVLAAPRRPAAGDNIGVRDHRPRAAASSAVLRARAWARSTPHVFDADVRAPTAVHGRRHVLDRRRDGRASAVGARRARDIGHLPQSRRRAA